MTRPGEPLECIEVAPPEEPRGREVVLAVTHCGVCHSDVHFWEGYIDLGDRKVPLSALGIDTPYTLGHEIVGRVAAVGPEVEEVRVGDIRLVYPWLGCGECADCARGNDNACAVSNPLGVRRPGGFGERVVVPDPRFLFDIEGLDPSLAATYACSGLTVYSAIAKLMPLEPDEPLVQIGAGGLGLNAVSVLRALGHRNIVVLDPSPANRQAALDLGARLAIDNGGKEDEALKAELDAAAGGPVKSILDLVNSSDTARFALAALQRGGRLVMVGLFGGTLTIPLMAFPTRGITIYGNYVGSSGELGELLELARGGRLAEIPITRRPFAEAGRSLAELRDGKVKGRIVLTDGAR